MNRAGESAQAPGSKPEREMPVASGTSCYRALAPSLPFGARDPEVTRSGARSLGFHAGLAVCPPRSSRGILQVHRTFLLVRMKMVTDRAASLGSEAATL